MLHREKVEKDLKGDYILMYPLVSYEREYEIQDQIKAREEEDKLKNKVVEEDEEKNFDEIAKEFGKEWA